MVQRYETLTEREKQTLRLLLVGYDAKSMARHFGLSVHTINERLRDARRKLSVSSSKEAARLLHEIESADPEFVGDAPFGGAVPASGDQPTPRPDPARRPLPRAIWVIGGLALMTLLAAILVLSSPHSVPQATKAAAPTSVAETDVSRAARAWLALVDDGKWSESWAAAAKSFKSLNTAERWRTASERVRTPLGLVLSRTLVGEEDMPAPPHGYRVVRFRTSFANRAEALETLSLDREGDNWKVVGIYVE